MDELLNGISEFVSMPAGQLAIGIFILMLFIVVYAIRTGNKSAEVAARLTEQALQLLKETNDRQGRTEEAQRAVDARQAEAMTTHAEELRALHRLAEIHNQQTELIRGALENQTSLLAKFAVSLDDLKRQQTMIADTTGRTLTAVEPLPGKAHDTLTRVEQLTAQIGALESSLDVRLSTITGAIETVAKQNREHAAQTAIDALATQLADIEASARDELAEIKASLTELLARTAPLEAP